MDFWRVVEILDRRKWLILFSVIVTVALTFGATRLVGTKWAATVHLVLLPTDGAIAPKTEEGDDPIHQEKVTEARASIYSGLIRNRNVLGPSLARIQENELTQQRLESMSFEVSGTNSYVLRVTDENPRVAELLANALAENLVREAQRIHSSQAKTVADEIDRQLVSINRDLEAARRSYDDYRRKNRVLGNMSDGMNLALSQLNASYQKRDTLREQLAEADARLGQERMELARTPRRIPDTTLSAPDPLIAALETQMAEAESQVTVLRARYTDEKIEVKQALAVRDALLARLSEERIKQAKTVRLRPNPAFEPLTQSVAQHTRETGGLRAQLDILNASIVRAESSARAAMGKDSTLSKLMADVSQKSEIRAGLAARKQNADLALDVTRGKKPLDIVTAVDRYNPPINTRSGRTKKLLLLAALCALLGASGLAVAFESVDRRVKGARDAGRLLPAPVCAAIPAPEGTVTPAALPRVTELQPLSVHAESYHFLGRLLLSSRGKGIRSVMALSTRMGGGGTATVTNLAISLAQAGKRVILVDANVRSPRIHAVFGLDNHYGLADVLREPGDVPLAKALHRTPVHNLFVLTSGRAPENPWEILNSGELAGLSDRLREIADYVLYDTPSAVAFTDAFSLSPVVDAAFLCVKAMEPLSGTEGQLVDTLKEEGVEVMGCVLTDVPAALLENREIHRQLAMTATRSLPPAPGIDAGGTREPSTHVQQWIETPGRNGKAIGSSREDTVLDDDGDTAEAGRREMTI